LWKVPVPLPGNNSPIIWKNRLFISGATKERREVYCFDTDSGKLLWKTNVTTRPGANAKPVKTNTGTGYASSTMATDGKRVYAIFATGDLTALDFSGNIVWTHSLGTPNNHYGHASSLRNGALVRGGAVREVVVTHAIATNANKNTHRGLHDGC